MKFMTQTTAHAYIGGAWKIAAGDRVFDVKNPATGATITQVSDCGEPEVQSAVDLAKRAFEDWSQIPAKQRAECLHRVASLMRSRDEELAEIIVLESGKPMREAIGEIRYGASYFQWFAEEAVRAYGDVIPSGSRTSRFIVTKHAIGVCALITPWNFPSAMMARKTAAALAAGCTVVAKPAEDTPLSALALAEILEEAGLPSGVFNVIPSSLRGEMGDWITSHPDIKKISFTGSTPVGRILFKQSADTLKKLSLELGGNAPFIVFDDADLDAATEGLMASKFRNAGQTCVCTNRVFVHRSIENAFADKLAKRVQDLNLGEGQDHETDIGPLINQSALEKISSLVASALSEQAKLVTGGTASPLGGLYYLPTILKNVSTDMKIAREEIFGPVVTLIPFDDDEDCIAKANDTEYGLAAYLYTESGKRSWNVSERLDYGMIGINEGVLSNAEIPFGGVKQSGQGREGSKYGLDDYMEIKFRLFGGL